MLAGGLWPGFLFLFLFVPVSLGFWHLKMICGGSEWRMSEKLRPPPAKTKNQRTGQRKRAVCGRRATVRVSAGICSIGNIVSGQAADGGPHGQISFVVCSLAQFHFIFAADNQAAKAKQPRFRPDSNVGSGLCASAVPLAVSEAPPLASVTNACENKFSERIALNTTPALPVIVADADADTGGKSLSIIFGYRRNVMVQK